MTLTCSFIILTFHQAQPQSITLFLTTLTFHVCFSSICEFKFTSFLILAISKPGESYKLLQRQKIQARGNKTVAVTRTNKNNALKFKDKQTKKSTCHDDLAIIFLSNFQVDFPIEFPLITSLLGLSAPLIRSSFYPDSFL